MQKFPTDSYSVMVPGKGPQSPSTFHPLFSTGVGICVPAVAHRQQFAPFILLLALWIGMQIFMQLRARQNRGVFIDEEIEFYSWLGFAGFSAGLLITSTFLVVFGR